MEKYNKFIDFPCIESNYEGGGGILNLGSAWIWVNTKCYQNQKYSQAVLHMLDLQKNRSRHSLCKKKKTLNNDCYYNIPRLLQNHNTANKDLLLRQS